MHNPRLGLWAYGAAYEPHCYNKHVTQSHSHASGPSLMTTLKPGSRFSVGSRTVEHRHRHRHRQGRRHRHGSRIQGNNRVSSHDRERKQTQRACFCAAGLLCLSHASASGRYHMHTTPHHCQAMGVLQLHGEAWVLLLSTSWCWHALPPPALPS